MYRGAEDRDGFRWRQLRNDPETLFWSKNTRPISPAEHDAWFRRVTASSDHRLLVYEDEIAASLGMPAITAYGRLQREMQAEVSFGVAATARRKGIGGGMLRALEHEALTGFGVQRLVAYVHPGNTASLQAFLHQGYVLGGHPGFVRVEKPL